MSAAGALAASVQRWFAEEDKHARHGDYAWLVERLGPAKGRRVLEIGCGAGFGSAALIAAGFEVLALEPAAPCRDAARERNGPSLRLLEADVTTLTAATRAAIDAFSPQLIVCWMIGVADLDSPAPATPAATGEHVRLARETIHRAVAELAVALPSVSVIQIADRTAFPWKIKDVGRETLVKYHAATTLKALPLSAVFADALFRKLDVHAWQAPGKPGRAGAAPGGSAIVPVLGALIVRKQ